MVDALAKEVEKEKMKVGLFLHFHCFYSRVKSPW